MSWRTRSLAFLSALALSGCGFEAPPPKLTPPPPEPAPVTSTVAATLTLPVATIVQALDDKTKPDIAHLKNKKVDCPVFKCHLDLTATRSGSMKGAARDGKLTLDLPFAVTAHLTVKSRLMKTGVDTNATGEAIAETSLGLNPDWKLEPKTVGVVRLQHGDMRVGPISMDLTDLWNRNEDHLSEPLFRAMDRRIASTVKVKDQAERLWSKAFRPIHVGKSPEAWLLLSPKTVRVSGIRTDNNALSVSLAVDTQASIVVGPRPSSPDKLPKLPAPLPLATPSSAFRVSVPALLPYDRAAELAMKSVTEKPIRVHGATVRFSWIKFLPSGADVVVSTRFCVSQGWDFFGWFDSCGTGYLRGKPVFDAQEQKVHIVNVRYDLQTAGVILSAMKMLAGPELGQALETRLIFDASRDIAKMQAQISKALAKPQGRGVEITGTIGAFGKPTLTWTKDGFLANFSAEGTIHADLNIQPPQPNTPRAPARTPT
ncbi:MAG: DUF4403 family protein [Proteobacteria bacterium]|nr:DUF4403 family protein [Pseudomonadota bacterium]